MSSKYPAELDALGTASSNSTKAKDVHPALHNDANAAINAVQETLGTTPFDWSGLVEDWHVIGDPGEPDFPMGFENADGTGAEIPAWEHSPDAPVAFYKDPLGVVHLRGAAVFLGAFKEELPPDPEYPQYHVYEERVFTLPEGYRPPALGGWVCPRSSAPEGTAGGDSEVAVLPDGRVGDYEHLAVRDNDPGMASLGSGNIGDGLYLDGISFRAAP